MKKESYPLLFPSFNNTTNNNDNLDSIPIVTAMINEKELNKIIEPIIKYASTSSKRNKTNKDKATYISKFILQTQFIYKLKADMIKDNKLTVSNLSYTCASLFYIEELKKDEVLYRMNDNGNKCYLIIDGCVNVLKPKYINELMTALHYLKYLYYLKRNKELYILNEVLKKNYYNFPIEKIEDISAIHRLEFIMKVKSNIYNESFDTDALLQLFKDYNQKEESFRILSKDIQVLCYNKKMNLINSIENWENYLNEHFTMTEDETAFYNKFTYLHNNKELEWICCQYEVKSKYGRGVFFGEASKENLDNKRKETIMADDNCVLAYMTNDSYRSIIAPKNKKKKPEEVYFLYENFFFRTISLYVFDKSYYHYFSQTNYIRNHILYSTGVEPTQLYFIKEGMIGVTIHCSVINLHNLIKYFVDKISSLAMFCNGSIRYPPIISKEKIEELKTFLQDTVLFRLKSQQEDFINDMNKSQLFHLFYLSEKEILGIEELILDIPYLTNAKFVSVNASLLAISKKNLLHILTLEQPSYYLYCKLAANKIISLIERLYHTKKNIIDLALFKVHDNEKTNKLNNPYKLKKVTINKSLLPSLSKRILMNKDNEGIDEEKSIDALNQSPNNSSKILNQVIKSTLLNNTKNMIDNSIGSNLKDYITNLNRNNDKGTFVNFHSKYISIQDLKRKLINFPSVDDNKNYVKLVMKSTDFDMLNNDTSQFNYSKYPQPIADKLYQPLTINELNKHNFSMSYLNLINSNKANAGSSRNIKKLISNCLSDKSTSLCDNDKIPNICRKSLTKCKPLTRNASSLASFRSCNDNISINSQTLKLENKSIQHSNVIINEIVKEYYSVIKKSGYSILAKKSNNSYFKSKDKLNRNKISNNNSKSNLSQNQSLDAKVKKVGVNQ